MAVMACLLGASSYGQPAVVSFKVGSFESDGRQFVGAVFNDGTIVDIAAASRHLPLSSPRPVPPTDMRDLIERYDDGLRELIMAIGRQVLAIPADGERPAYAYSRGDLAVLPPVPDPRILLNTAVNYTEHGLEMKHVRSDGPGGGGTPPGLAGPDTRRPAGIWQPGDDDMRWNPYMFLKSPAAIIGDGEAIRLPDGRPQIDWECELAIVIGKKAKNVKSASANDYIFGYTIELDVSDREERGDERYGSDWLIGKSRDTFAPMGPFITPKEFVQDPADLDITFELNGTLMQQSNTRLMIHNVFELVEYASHIHTLVPGDIIGSGTPSGVGSARKPPIFLSNGDRTACTYEGVGTLRNTVRR